MSAPVHLPAAARRVQPWKNGGGRTTTIVEAPAGAGLAALDWRISIADIDAPGPFSFFPGMTRHLLVLEGVVRLLGKDIDTDRGVNDDVFTFSGEAAICATPLEPPVRVLNVMVRSDRYRGVLAPAAPASAGVDIAVYVARRDTVLAIEGRDVTLRHEDGVLITRAASTIHGPGIIAVEILDL